MVFAKEQMDLRYSPGGFHYVYMIYTWKNPTVFIVIYHAVHFVTYGNDRWMDGWTIVYIYV